MKRKITPKDFKCVVCQGNKRRCDLVVFLRQDYDFNLQHVRNAFAMHNEKPSRDVVHVCKGCHVKYSKDGHGSRPTAKDYAEILKDIDYLCTSCHSKYRNRNDVVVFKKQNYDFDNEAIREVLSKNKRCKQSIYEYMCKVCHEKLRNPHSRSMNVQANFNWNAVLVKMGRCSSFVALEKYVKTLHLPPLPKEFKGMKQQRNYRRDNLAYGLIPDDVGVRKEDLFPVETSGQGSCFYYALSRLVYGDESHFVEMRVRIVVEGIQNMNLYLNHDLLCRGYDFPHEDGEDLTRVYCTYSSVFQDGMNLDHESVINYYKTEMFKLRNISEYSGIWQFHQAASVLGCRLQSVFPHTPIFNLRQDLNRMVLPMDLDGPNVDKVVRIMWTKCVWNSRQFNHFVALVDSVHDMPFVEVNMQPLGYTEKVEKCAPIEIDLTEDSEDVQMDVTKDCTINSSISSDSFFPETLAAPVDTKCAPIEIDLTEDSQDVAMDVTKDCTSNSSIPSDTSPAILAAPVDVKNSFESVTYICTSCHQMKKRRNIIIFEKEKYDHGNSVVKNVLSDDIRCRDEDRKEYICRTCDKNLKGFKYPQKCVFLDQEKLCRQGKSQSIKARDDIKKMEKNRQKQEREEKMVCKVAEYEQKKNAENDMKERIEKEMNVEVNDERKNLKAKKLLEKAKKKFRASCKEFPDYVCVCCHRVFFKKSVQDFDRGIYPFHGASLKALDEKYFFKNKDQAYICRTCHRDLLKNRLPAQAVANGLEIPEVPKELEGLTLLERRCIGLRIPFMMIRALPKGGLGKIRGPCINVPATVQPIADVLPRLPDNIDLIWVEFKRMLVYKSNHYQDYIRPHKVMTALRWLKQHNEHYNHVQIDEDWLQKFEKDPMCGQLKEDSKSEEAMTIDENMEFGQANHDSNQPSDIDLSNIQEKKVCHGNADLLKVCRKRIKKQQKEENDSADSSGDDENDLKEAQQEHDRLEEIRIGASSTCIQIEDLDNAVFSIAPGQDAVPKYILLDDDFEVLAFPDYFPKGKLGYNLPQKREAKLNLRRYINQRLLNRDRKFSQNQEYIFAFQYATEIKQLKGDMYNALKRTMTNGRKVNAGDVRNFEKFNELVFKDIAYKFMKNVRGTPAYWQVQLMDTLAMMRTFGTPTWFISLSPAEFLWPEFTQAVGKRLELNWTEEDVAKMSWQTKATNFKDNPVTVCQMFHNRLEAFFSDFLLSDAHPLGEITEHIEKIEFQARGSPHAHCLIWVKDAPSVDVNTDEEVCRFVDKYISGKIPVDSKETEDVRNLVKKLQTHVHSPYCREHVNARCRFNFPKPPSTRTIIARKGTDDATVSIDEKTKRHILEMVHERIKEEDGSSLREILDSEHIPEELYLDCLRTSSHRGTTVILERDIADCKTNNFNPMCIHLWRANMDIQYVADPYACIMYVLSYVLKCENGMSEILKRVAREFKEESVRNQMGKILSTFANKREVSVHEAIHRVTSQWLFRKSRSVVYVNNAPKEERHRMPKSPSELAVMEDEDEDVFMASIHDRYAARPNDLEDLCLAAFATKYNRAPKDAKGKNVIHLKDNSLGQMTKRTTDAVLRTHKFKDETYQFYFSKLLLFLPWRKEQELIEGYNSYQQHYNEVMDIVEHNAASFNLNTKDIDDALEEYMNNPPTVSEWLDVGAGPEDLLEQDFGDDQEDGGVGKNKKEDKRKKEKKEKESDLSLKYKAEARRETISPEEYCVMMRNLNKEQREIVMFNRSWIKESIAQMRKGEEPKTYQVFLSGPGGTGKSHVIKMMYRDNTKLYRRYFAGKPSEFGGVEHCGEDVLAILCAYTGTAAFNIDGMTLHSAFQLHNSRISDERKTVMRTRLHRLQHITIDEVSMVGTYHLNLVNNRCAMFKYRNPNDYDFGGINVLAVGDFYQLSPVRQTELFAQQKTNARCPKDLAPKIWDKFLFHELTQPMRQKDTEFASMLNTIRVSRPEENSDADKMLKAREMQLSDSDPAYPNDVLHVYAQNAHCTVRNEKMLGLLDGPLYYSKGEDSIEDLKVDISQLNLESLAASKTGNLPHILLLKVGARVFLSSNIDVTDGLTNGVFGTVSGIITTTHHRDSGESIEEVRVVLVRFDSDKVGRQAKAKSLYKNLDGNAVPICKAETKFSTKTSDSSKTVSVTRRQFPLILAWAVTIHKVQGMTMDNIVVDMSRNKGAFSEGQAYVAFSRVRTCEGLHLINYDRHQIRASRKVKKEMERLRKDRKLPTIPRALLWSFSDDHVCLVHLNVQGLNARSRTKIVDLHEDKEIQEVDIICLSETHYSPDMTISVNNIWPSQNGHLYRVERHNRKGGGIAIAVTDKYTSKQIALDSPLEAIAVEVYCPSKVIIICVYVTPSASKIVVSQLLAKYINQVACARDKVLIVGDFNEDLLDGEQGKVICNSLSGLGFEQLISKPTTDYGSLLDHVYSRKIDNIEVDVQDAYYSDHDKVFCFFK